MASIPRERALTTIETELTPLIGESMARSSVKLHTEKLGLNGSELDRGQVDALLTQIGLAMRVFVGADKADALLEKVKATLFGEGA